MHSPHPREAADEAILLAALSNSHHKAWPALVEHFTSLILVISRRRAPDLPDDLYEEVAQELYAALALSTVAAYVASGKTARCFVASFSSNALTRVRAAYRFPGERSRARRRRLRQPAQLQIVQDSMAPGRQAALPDPSTDQLRAQLEARVDVGRARELAPAGVRPAIDALILGATMEEAADSAGLSRPTLIRRLAALQSVMVRAA